MSPLSLYANKSISLQKMMAPSLPLISRIRLPIKTNPPTHLIFSSHTDDERGNNANENCRTLREDPASGSMVDQPFSGASICPYRASHLTPSHIPLDPTPHPTDLLQYQVLSCFISRDNPIVGCPCKKSAAGAQDGAIVAI